jgi:hypothetical protein
MKLMIKEPAMKRSRILTSVLTGAATALLLTAPLLGLMFLAQQVLGTPFIPFDVFDLVSRILPGSVITAGIDGMVAVLTALGCRRRHCQVGRTGDGGGFDIRTGAGRRRSVLCLATR